MKGKKNVLALYISWKLILQGVVGWGLATMEGQ